MQIIRFDEIMEDIGSSIRSHYINILPQRQAIVEIFSSKNLEMREFIVDNWDRVLSSGPYTFIEHSGMTFPLRAKKASIIWIANHEVPHMRSSVIANILVKEDEGSIKDRLDKIIYLYYHFWFMKKEADINSITHNVCFELQDIIKQLIEKELGLYRQYNTSALIDAVRWRLSSENLLLMARVPSLNMRRL